MILTLLFLFQSIQPTFLYDEITQDLGSLPYDSLAISGRLELIKPHNYVRRKAFRAGNNLVKIKIGSKYKLIPVKISIYNHVWETNSYVKRSKKIVDIHRVFKETTFIKHPILGEAIDFVAAKSIRRGQVLTKSNTRRAYDCRFGQSLLLEYKLNGLSIKVDAKVMSDGFIGETVTVQLKSNHKKIRGRLISKGVVRHETF